VGPRNIIGNVVRRFVRTAAVQIPQWLRKAVSSEELDAETLGIWDYVVTALEDHYNEAYAAAYWRNKVDQLGFEVSDRLGPATPRRWSVKPGDAIERWSKENRRSMRLIDEQSTLIHAWLSDEDVDLETLDLLGELRDLLGLYQDHTTPSLEFEQDVQVALLVVDKQLDKHNVAGLDRAMRQLKRNF